ncbi:MAG: NmrA family NAD(P)-binding protein [Chromatiales bacterium]|nr:NmrA family NAD(P)-binding protein [Chromatiales bacterium]
MDRDTAVSMGQQAIKANNRRLVEAVLRIRAERGEEQADARPVEALPVIGVTCATGWECYAIVDELVKTARFRVRALYRTPGTQAAARLDRLLARTEETHPGLLTLHPGVDMNSTEALTKAFDGCDGVVLYLTANTSKAGKVTNHGKDPVGGRTAVMRQAMASLAALKANPCVKQVITLIFPTDKVTGIADKAPPIPWWIDQKLRLSDFLRGQGINVTCIYRPAYYYAMHRVEYDSDQTQFRGDTSLSRTLIRENNIPGITPPDFLVNWVDVRDIGKWVGTCLEYPEVFSNEDLSIASSAHTGHELVALAEKHNRHGTRFRYRQFPMWVMKMISLFNDEVVYPLRYAQWYNDEGNGYDFASNDDLADLERIHPRWSFERELEAWGINDLKPAAARPDSR